MPGSTFEVTWIAEMEAGGVLDAFASVFADPNENLTQKLLKAGAVYFITAKMLPPSPARAAGHPCFLGSSCSRPGASRRGAPTT